VFNWRAIGNRVATHYDKLLAVVMLCGLLGSLLYLAVQVGLIQTRQKQFVRLIDALQPRHPDAAEPDTAVYENALRSFQEPAQITNWAQAMFIPERRVSCVDCRRPIPYDASVCPFCAVVQPPEKEDRPDYDGDGDGMWDAWERAHGLDPRDPRDAAIDTDDDGFTNLEEFLAEPQTDPRDPDAHPSIIAKLRVADIKADPFKLRFKSVITLPDGNLKFAINTRGNTRTYFRRLNEQVEGFTLFKYTPRTEERTAGGITRADDVSILTLKRGDKLIPLVKGQDVQYNEYMALLVFTVDGSEYTVRVDDEITLARKAYKVISIDTQKRSLVIRRLQDNRDLVIRGMNDSVPVTTQSGGQGEGLP
jgi:hypothetical protein